MDSLVRIGHMNFDSSVASLFLVLLFPVVYTLWGLLANARSGESKAGAKWISFRIRNRIVCLAMVAVWWALWDLNGRSALISTAGPHLDEPQLALIEIAVFWLLPLSSIAIAKVLCLNRDRTILHRTWTMADILQITLWSTISPFAAILLVATGIEALGQRDLPGIAWLLGAAVSALIGTVGLRRAEGLKFRRVKSGELYKRASVLARAMQVQLESVEIVPGGRGHLTNAYGGSKSIAMTDNYGKFLSGLELDAIILHELGHCKHRHGIKKVFAIPAIYLGLAILCFCFPVVAPQFIIVRDFLVVFAPMLLFYFILRKFEYAADRASVEFLHRPEIAIRALASIHRNNESPLHYNWVEELFMTHPAFTRRALAMGRVGKMSAENISKAICEADFETKLA